MEKVVSVSICMDAVYNVRTELTVRSIRVYIPSERLCHLFTIQGKIMKTNKARRVGVSVCQK